MMKAKDMNKVTVFGPKSYMKEIIETLYNLNVVHIEDYTKKTEEDYFEIGEPYAENEKYADILIKLRTMISKLGLRKSGKNPSKISIKEIESKTNELYDRITALLRKEEYFSDIKRAYEKKKVEEAVSSLKLGSESDYSSMAHYVGFINTNEAEFKEKVGKLTAKFELYWTNYDGIPVMALLAGVKKHDKIIRLLNEYEFSPMDNPLVKKQLKLKSKSGIKFVKEDYQLKLVTEKLEHIKKEIEKLKEHNSGFLEEAEKKLSIEAEKAEAPLRIATTKNTFLIKGWVPVENKEKLQSSLEAITKGRVMVEFEKPTTKEKPPIAFNHPKIVEPFEAFMNLYTLPSYKEIDPTFFMFLTFPIFFGFMLGDVGYGLVILTLFLILKKKMPGAKNFLNAFIIAAVASIAFGAVFGEYFGYEEVSPGVAAALGIHPEEIFSHGEIFFSHPGSCVKKYEAFEFFVYRHRLAFSREGEVFISGYNNTGFSFIFRRIGNRERNTIENIVSNWKFSQVVIRPLVAPASFSVSGLFIGKGHIRGWIQGYKVSVFHGQRFYVDGGTSEFSGKFMSRIIQCGRQKIAR